MHRSNYILDGLKDLPDWTQTLTLGFSLIKMPISLFFEKREITYYAKIIEPKG